jgi:hypothetical protein
MLHVNNCSEAIAVVDRLANKGEYEEMLHMPEKRTASYQIALLILICLLAMIVLPSCDETPDVETSAKQISMSFEEYMDQGEETWFLTGKKQYSVQAMMVSKETHFHNELEVTDYTVADDGVTVILKGNFDEMWATKLSKVIFTYTKPDGSALCEADFADRDAWIEIITKPEPDAYYAMHVPVSISVTVETAWGDVLHTNLPNAPHGEGDYLVCRVGEDGKPDLSDVWILNGIVFPEYYDTSRRLIKYESDAA